MSDEGDMLLNAYFDGGLDLVASSDFEMRLAGEPGLAADLARLKRLSTQLHADIAEDIPSPALRRQIARRFASPSRRLTATFERARATFAAKDARQERPSARRGLRPLAAAVAIFLAGGAVGLGVAHFAVVTQIARNESKTTDGNWRATVAEYLTLYTRETLANLPHDRSLREAELKSVGDKLALPLSVDKVTITSLSSAPARPRPLSGARISNRVEPRGTPMRYISERDYSKIA
jgi:hypothetical protein